MFVETLEKVVEIEWRRVEVEVGEGEGEREVECDLLVVEVTTFFLGEVNCCSDILVSCRV